MASSAHILYAPVSNLYADFTHPRKRCLRYSAEGATVAARRKQRGPRIPWPEHCVCLVPPGEKWLLAHVFRVSLSEDFHNRWSKQPKNFYIVAMHEGAVQSYLEKRYGNLFQRYSGMARYALDLAMQQTSTRNVRHEKNVTGKARSVADANVVVRRSLLGAIEVRIEDNLSYAAAALRTGRAGVRLALKKAANSVAGMLNKVAGEKLDRPIPTPFKEIVA